MNLKFSKTSWLEILLFAVLLVVVLGVISLIL